MRSSRCIAFRSTPALLHNYGPTFLTGGSYSEELENAVAHPTNERGIKSSSMWNEPNTAVYDTHFPWTYFQPQKVNIEALPAPEAKYYQRFTKRPWDISSTEWQEMTTRKRFIQSFWYAFLFFMVYFYLPKEKSFSGSRGTDGFWALLPKNQPHLF